MIRMFLKERSELAVINDDEEENDDFDTDETEGNNPVESDDDGIRL